MWDVRPRACATYPFWNNHLISPLDWRGAASLCEGIQLGSEPLEINRSQSDVQPDHTVRTTTKLPAAYSSDVHIDSQDSFADIIAAGTDIDSSFHNGEQVLVSLP